MSNPKPLVKASVLRAKAEIAIQKALLDLESATGRKIKMVEVDTRNFANLNVEIFFEDTQQ